MIIGVVAAIIIAWYFFMKKKPTTTTTTTTTAPVTAPAESSYVIGKPMPGSRDKDCKCPPSNSNIWAVGCCDPKVVKLLQSLQAQA